MTNLSSGSGVTDDEGAQEAGVNVLVVDRGHGKVGLGAGFVGGLVKLAQTVAVLNLGGCAWK